VVLGVSLTLLAVGFAAGLLLGWMALHVYRRVALLAKTKTRSFHDAPTPTAGGVVFVLPLVTYLVWLGVLGAQPAFGLAAGTAVVAACGFWDDVRELPAAPRLALQAVVAAVTIAIVAPGLAWLPAAVLTLALLWHINLYNFMDGIDGIAAAQALVFLLGSQVVAGGLPGWSGDVAWLAVGGLIAFLAFNWPPARLFMGDTGSAFLGLLTGALALLWWQQGSLPLPSALILLAAFWLDATYTLIVRIVTGQAFTQAHRSHLYQKVAAKRGHLWTTVVFLLYAVVWLLPLAWLSALTAPDFSLLTLLWLFAAVAPLGFAAWRLGAARPDDPAAASHAR
jgi:Fuc2NAc and GlcNAc transferase